MTDDREAAIATPTTVKRRAVEAGCCMWAPILPPIAAIEPELKSDGATDSIDATSFGAGLASVLR